MDDFEKYLNSFEEQEYPYLIFCALLHGQFEMIHPFSDGNGRIGRLLVHLMLQHMGVLKKPILYLSYYFRRYRKDYYSLLNNLSKDGDWESWIIFFLNAVADVAKRATSIYQRAAEMRKDHLKLIERSENKGASKIRTVFDLLFAYPVVTAKLISHNANISMPAIYHNIQKLTSLGLLNEISGQSRSRMYMYVPLFELLESES
jgi:Fic family protein